MSFLLYDIDIWYQYFNFNSTEIYFIGSVPIAIIIGLGNGVVVYRLTHYCVMRGTMWTKFRLKEWLIFFKHFHMHITVMSLWAWWHLKSMAYRLFDQPFVQAKIKETSKLRFTGLCEGNALVTGEFPPQVASNAENVSISWWHDDFLERKLFWFKFYWTLFLRI